VVRSWPRAAEMVPPPRTGAHLQAQHPGTALVGGPAPRAARPRPSLAPAAMQPTHSVGSHGQIPRRPGDPTEARGAADAQPEEQWPAASRQHRSAPPARQGPGPRHLRDARGPALQVLTGEKTRTKPSLLCVLPLLTDEGFLKSIF